MRFIFLYLILALVASVGAFAQSFPSTFTWPSGVSNAGPYTLATATHSTVFTPNGSAITEANIATHQYQHHTKIYWQSGTAMLACSSGFTNEADGGQQTIIFFSTNRGVTWTAPTLIVPSQSLWTNFPTGGTTAIGSRITYPRNFETFNGTNWLISAVDHYYDTSLHERGDALIACAVFTNGTVGPLFLISTNLYSASNSYPVSVPSYDTTLGPILITNSIVYGTWGGNDQAGGPFTRWTHWYFDGSNTLVEPVTFSADGSASNLYRFWRKAGPADTNLYFVHQTFSTNGGSTWSEVLPSGIPNSPSETTGLRLDDGRFAILGNSKNWVGSKGRDPLFLAITAPNSTTITNVSAVQQGIEVNPTWVGWAKGGGASYVSAVQVGNYLYVGYSLQKESIGFSRVLIPGLADNNNDGPIPVTLNVQQANVGTLKVGQ